jgi:hypothetical protein
MCLICTKDDSGDSILGAAKTLLLVSHIHPQRQPELSYRGPQHSLPDVDQQRSASERIESALRLQQLLQVRIGYLR